MIFIDILYQQCVLFGSIEFITSRYFYVIQIQSIWVLRSCGQIHLRLKTLNTQPIILINLN